MVVGIDLVWMGKMEQGEEMNEGEELHAAMEGCCLNPLPGARCYCAASSAVS